MGLRRKNSRKSTRNWKVFALQSWLDLVVAVLLELEVCQVVCPEECLVVCQEVCPAVCQEASQVLLQALLPQPQLLHLLDQRSKKSINMSQLDMPSSIFVCSVA